MHILTALGSLHESLEIAYSTWSNEEANSMPSFSLQQYHQGIGLLKKGCGKLPIEVILISHILLVCFETLKKDCKSASTLLRGGFTILIQSRNPIAVSVKDEVVQAFSPLTMQASAYIDVEAEKMAPITSLFREKHTLLPQIEMSSSFFSLQQASVSLDSIIGGSYAVMDVIVFAPNYQLTYKLLTRIGALLDTWYGRLMVFLSKQEVDDIQFQRQVLYLKMQYFTAYIMSPRSSEYGDNELRFDNFNKEFGIINSLAAEWINLDATYGNQPVLFSGTGVSYNFNMGIIPPLFLCGLRCRCPVIR